METIVNATQRLIVPGNDQQTVQFAAEDFVKTGAAAIQEKGYFSVALSGGSTPKKVYEKLASSFESALDWSKVLLFFSDERVVPLNSPESNYKMAMDAGFSKLGLRKENIFPVPNTGIPPDDAASYEKLILSKMAGGVFDLMLLGVGDDGHTASLFPHTEALYIQDRLFVSNYVPVKLAFRQTVTFKCINEAKKVVVWAFGASKKDILQKVLYGEKQPDLYPIQSVGVVGRPATFIVDESAS